MKERSATKKARFLDGLAAGLTVADAAKLSATNRSLAYHWRKRDPEFRAAWDAAEAAGTDVLIGEATRRAVKGVVRPVLYQGRQVLNPETGEPLFQVEYSDTILMFLLKSRDPERFCDRARTAKLMRKWAKADAKAAKKSTGDEFKPIAEVLQLLADAAAAKAASPEAAAKH